MLTNAPPDDWSRNGWLTPRDGPCVTPAAGDVICLSSATSMTSSSSTSESSMSTSSSSSLTSWSPLRRSCNNRSVVALATLVGALLPPSLGGVVALSSLRCCCCCCGSLLLLPLTLLLSWPFLASSAAFLLRFHFMRRFWNQIFTWKNNKLTMTHVLPAFKHLTRTIEARADLRETRISHFVKFNEQNI